MIKKLFDLASCDRTENIARCWTQMKEDCEGERKGKSGREKG